jgi:hypothetical protein
MGVHGIPDIICCLPAVVTPDMVGRTVGLFVGIETKAPGRLGNVTELQKYQIERIRAAGGIACVVDGVEVLAEEIRYGRADT